MEYIAKRRNQGFFTNCIFVGEIFYSGIHSYSLPGYLIPGRIPVEGFLFRQIKITDKHRTLVSVSTRECTTPSPAGLFCTVASGEQWIWNPAPRSDDQGKEGYCLFQKNNNFFMVIREAVGVRGYFEVIGEGVGFWISGATNGRIVSVFSQVLVSPVSWKSHQNESPWRPRFSFELHESAEGLSRVCEETHSVFFANPSS